MGAIKNSRTDKIIYSCFGECISSSSVMAATSKILPAMWAFYVVFALFYVVNCTKLNVPKVLLPYHSSVAANFTLEADVGCLKW